jgi:hypothetical protein
MSLPLLKAPKGWKRARYIYIKGVTERFDFDAVRTSQLQMDCQKQSNGNAPWDVYIQPVLAIGVKAYWSLTVKYILIGVGLSALLVSTIRAMRRPLQRGTSIRLAPRFLCLCHNTYNHY